MKIERTNKAFQPIELKITIETEEELGAINVMSQLDDSIPDLFTSSDSKIIEEFLGKIYSLLDVD